MKLGLEGKTAIITGSGGGIGAETAWALAEEGVQVVMTDIRGKAAEDIASHLQVKGFKATAFTTDVTDSGQVAALVAHAIEAFGGVDILVNNAGFPRDRYLTKMSEEDWDTVVDVILKGAFHCSKAVLSLMMAQAYGRIINISSRAHLGNPGQANYSAAKAGILGFTRALSLEQGRYNITVNAIAPGAVDTEGLKAIPNYEKVKAAAIAKTPLPRLGEARDIANGVVFLASECAGYITGETLHITGGRYA